MAVLETIRTKFGVIITILIAISLLSFIVDPSSLISVFNSSQNVVGKIDGQSVGYEEYKNKVDELSLMYGNNSSEEIQAQVQDAAWQYFVDRELFFPAAGKSGVQVGDAEMSELLAGNNISPVLRQNFQGASDQEITDYVKQLATASSTNSEAAAAWQRLKDVVYNARMYEKYNVLFTESYMPNALEEANFVTEVNTVDSVRYVMVPYGFQKDSTIQVSESEIKSYYNKMEKTFTQKASREIEYVVFQLEPSEADRENTRAEFDRLLEEFTASSDLSKFSKKKYLEKPQYWFKEGELNTYHHAIDDFVFNGDGQTTSSAIVSGDDFMAVKVIDTKAIPDSMFVHHIILGETSAPADSLIRVITETPSKFAQLAAANTMDKTAGEGQWFTQAQLIQGGLSDAILAGINKPFQIEENGINAIFMVSKQTKATPKKKVVILKSTVYPSTQTQNDLYAQANEFAQLAGTSVAGLEAAAQQKEQHLATADITEDRKSINDVKNAREVTRWAFGADQGDVSGVLKAGQNYFIVALTGIHKEGVSTLDEVRASIETKLYNQKRSAKLLEEVKGKVQGCTTIDDAAKALSEDVQAMEGVSFFSMYGNYGMDQAAVAAVSSVAEGQLTAPVAGDAGVYMLVPVKREVKDNITSMSLSDRQSNINSYNARLIGEEMFKMTGSKDNRAHFF